ncbi:MAG: hypothetical protein EBZ49_03085, partial [Proteobacteria bacterium]|nr:hypothetical protein [Pseudomonadota bacterium]
FYKFKTIILGLLPAFFLGEIISRVAYRSLFTSDNFILRDFSIQRAPEYQSDDILGWSPTPNYKSTKPKLNAPQLKPWQFTVRKFNEAGFRKHPQLNSIRLLTEKKPLITLGDSFTFGGDVNDEETWPFHLEQLLRYPVLNAGVNRYGLDQSFLRLRRLLKTGLDPGAVILSITPLNISKTTLSHLVSTTSQHPLPKPYFQLLEDGTLDLHLPDIKGYNPTLKLDPIRNTLGKSAFLHIIFSLISYPYWYGTPDSELGLSSYRTKGSKIDITCSILKDLKQLSEQYRFIFVALIQDYHQAGNQAYRFSELTQGIKPCLSELKVLTIESSAYLKPLFEGNPNEYHTLFFPGGHMTNRGNLLTAKLIYDELKRMAVEIPGS